MKRYHYKVWNMRQWILVWAPEGRIIAHVQARTSAEARLQAPLPYRRYLGEVYAMDARVERSLGTEDA